MNFDELQCGLIALREAVLPDVLFNLFGMQWDYLHVVFFMVAVTFLVWGIGESFNHAITKKECENLKTTNKIILSEVSQLHDDFKCEG